MKAREETACSDVLYLRWLRTELRASMLCTTRIETSSPQFAETLHDFHTDWWLSKILSLSCPEVTI